MIGMKRTYTTTKNNVNRYSSKGKDASKQQNSSRHKSFEMLLGEADTTNATFPLIKQSDNAKSLQRYTTSKSKITIGDVLLMNSSSPD